MKRPDACLIDDFHAATLLHDTFCGIDRTYLERSASSSALIGSLPPSNTMTGLIPCWRSSSTLPMQKAMCLQRAFKLEQCIRGGCFCSLDITMKDEGQAKGLASLVCGGPFAKLPAAGIATLVEPAVSVHCHRLVRKFSNVRLSGDFLQTGQQALYSHSDSTAAYRSQQIRETAQQNQGRRTQRRVRHMFICTAANDSRPQPKRSGQL